MKRNVWMVLVTVFAISFSLLSPIAPADAENLNFTYGELIRHGVGGKPMSTVCPDGAAAVGITIATINGNSILPDFRLECNLGVMPADRVYFKPTQRTFLSNALFENQTTRTTYCPPNSVLVGLSFSTKVYIRDVGLICGDASGTSNITWQPKLGAGAGEAVPETSKCAPTINGPTFVVGVDGYGAAGVDAMRVICGNPILNNGGATENGLLGVYMPSGKVLSTDEVPAGTYSTSLKMTPLKVVSPNNSFNTDTYDFITSTTLVDLNHYYQFSIAPTSNKKIVLNKITFASASWALGSGKAPSIMTGLSATLLTIRTSEDNFQNDVVKKSLKASDVSQDITLDSNDLKGLPKFAGETIFRMYFLGATGHQYNSLRGQPYGTGMKIFGEILDSSGVAIPAIKQSPLVPNKFTTEFKDGKLTVSVNLQSDYKTLEGYKVMLLAPDLGYPESKELKAVITNNIAKFSISVDSALSEKQIPIQVWAVGNGLESDFLVELIDIPKFTKASPKATAKATPKATPKATAKATAKATPKVTPKPKTVRCIKAGTSARTFNGSSCPPGWSKS